MASKTGQNRQIVFVKPIKDCEVETGISFKNELTLAIHYRFKFNVNLIMFSIGTEILYRGSYVFKLSLRLKLFVFLRKIWLFYMCNSNKYMKLSTGSPQMVQSIVVKSVNFFFLKRIPMLPIDKYQKVLFPDAFVL